MFSSKVGILFFLVAFTIISLFVNYGFWAGVLGGVIAVLSSGIGVLSLVAKANGEIR